MNVKGSDSFHGVDFEGTFFISDKSDDDFVGFVFSYQSNRKFYFVSWKKGYQQYWKSEPFLADAYAGITIKLVNSTTGPGEFLRNSLWQTASVRGQTTLLKHSNEGWKANTAYKWELVHRPSIGLIRFWIYEGSTVIWDSKNIIDRTLKGGRIGVYCFSQELITWSNLQYRCRGK